MHRFTVDWSGVCVPLFVRVYHWLCLHTVLGEAVGFRLLRSSDARFAEAQVAGGYALLDGPGGHIASALWARGL